MVNNCAVRGCKSRGNKNGIKYYRFPREQELRIQWIKSTGRIDLFDIEPTKVHNYRVCSLHFDEESKFEDNQNVTNLKYRAVPTLLLPDELPNQIY